MSKEEILKWLIIIIILFGIFHIIFTELYIKYGLHYDRDKIEKVCFNPAFYDCESIIKIKEYCNYRPYNNRLLQCEIKNGSG